MLDGWYCRTMANEQHAATEHTENDEELDANICESGGSEDDSQEDAMSAVNQKLVDYKLQYTNLKKKLKFLLYVSYFKLCEATINNSSFFLFQENEFFQDALRSSQRRLLKVTRDKSFLLDRLLQYEKPDATSSESDETESSEDESSRIEPVKKRKVENPGTLGSNIKNQNPIKRKRVSVKKQSAFGQIHGNLSGAVPGGHMTAEEVERHLQSRQSLMELVPEKAPPTVPDEMFSNEPSLDSESNDQLIETSPSNIGEECLSVDMNIIQD